MILKKIKPNNLYTSLLYIAIFFLISFGVFFYLLFNISHLIASLNSQKYIHSDQLVYQKLNSNLFSAKEKEKEQEESEEENKKEEKENWSGLLSPEDHVSFDEKEDEPIFLSTPSPLRALYMTSWVAGTEHIRRPIIEFIKDSELNAIVIDIKDETGRISWSVQDPFLTEVGSAHRRIRDLRELILELNENDIYVIGRVSVFQDQFLSETRPDLAVKKADKETVWTDRKGLSWVDPGSEDVWDYSVAIAREARAMGFDEINFDYIRFPTDGNLSDIYYPMSEGVDRLDVLRAYYQYLHNSLGEDMPISADLFGLTTTGYDDLGIGQVWEDVLPYFDYIAPMVYPSHYPPGFIGLANPAEHPYQVIEAALKSAVRRTEDAGFDSDKIRPWLQDFDLGANYTADKIIEQRQAVYDLGLDSWMFWSPSNVYTLEGFDELER